MTCNLQKYKILSALFYFCRGGKGKMLERLKMVERLIGVGKGNDINNNH